MAKILIIDDSWLARRGIAAMFKNDNHDLYDASDGATGLELARSLKPDCIILDLMMPDISGFDVLITLKNEGLNIPVIILSADIQKSSREKAMQLGARDYLKKPPDLETLRSTVNKHLKY